MGSHAIVVLFPRGRVSKHTGTVCFWSKGVRSPSEEQLLSWYHLEVSSTLSYGVRGRRQVLQGIISDLIPLPPLQQQHSSTPYSVCLFCCKALRKLNTGTTGTELTTANEPKRQQLREATSVLWWIFSLFQVERKQILQKLEQQLLIMHIYAKTHQVLRGEMPPFIKQ